MIRAHVEERKDVHVGERGDGFPAGAYLSGALGRKDDATPRVEGLGEIKTSAQLGVFANWTSGPLLVEGGYQHALHAGYGGQGYLKSAWTFTLCWLLPASGTLSQ